MGAASSSSPSFTSAREPVRSRPYTTASQVVDALRVKTRHQSKYTEHRILANRPAQLNHHFFFSLLGILSASFPEAHLTYLLTGFVFASLCVLRAFEEVLCLHWVVLTGWLEVYWAELELSGRVCVCVGEEFEENMYGKVDCRGYLNLVTVLSFAWLSSGEGKAKRICVAAWTSEYSLRCGLYEFEAATLFSNRALQHVF